jgi:hypothetical protein
MTRHARERARERGATEQDIQDAIAFGVPEMARRGLTMYRFNREFRSEWAGAYYEVQQVAPFVAEEEHRLVVVTVYTFFF